MKVEQQPLVSAIVIFLNEERFLAEAIESVIAQTYDNWELLLCDDGSTDGSTEIAHRYVSMHPERIRYLEHDGHENRGMSATRNLGLRHARGEYIALLDGDDLWLPRKFEWQVPKLMSHPQAGLLYGNTYFWEFSEPCSDPPESGEIPSLGVAPDTIVDPPLLLTMLLENEDIHPTTCSMLLRRSLIEQIGGYEETFKRLYTDTPLLAKAMLETKVYVTGETSAVYRLHQDSWCHRALETGEYTWSGPNPGRGAYLSWLEEYLQDSGATNRQLWKALKRELFPYKNPRLYRMYSAASTIRDRARAVLSGSILRTENV